jgi:exopolysaccharide production protein ExoQ
MSMQWLYIVWLGLFPFVHQFSVYEGAKVVWLWCGGFVLAAWWVVRLLVHQTFDVRASDRWFLIWLGFLTLSSFLGIHPVESIVGGGYRHQGVLFFLTVFLIAQTVRLLTPGAKRLLGIVLAAGGVVESAYVLWQRYSMLQERPLGTLGEPNATAGYIAIGLYWLLHGSFHWVVKVLALSLCMAGIVATESRIGLGAATIILGAYGWSMRADLLKRKHHRAAAALFWGMIIALSGVAVFLTYIFATRPTSLYENRPLFWRMAIDAIEQRPWFGYGAESSETVFAQTFEQNSVHLWGFVIERGHNLFLDVAMWSGLVGLALFLGWIGATLKYLRERKSVLSYVTFVAWIAFACIQPLGVVHWAQVMLLVAIRWPK